MPRQQTAAEERTRQNHRLQDDVSRELGVPVSLARARAHRRAQRDGSTIVAREVDFEDTELVPIGVVLARVDNYKVTKGATATLSLVTNAREFGAILHEAGLVSVSDQLAIALYSIPRPVLDEDDDDEWDD